MLAVLSAPGSRGDVNPMIAIGRELRSRGHDVVISLAQPYASLATDAGLIAEPVISTERFDELLSSPDVWKPIRGARIIVGTVASEFLPLHLDVIQRHYVTGQTVLVSHPLDFASRIFRDAEPTTPLMDVHLAPAMLRTYDDPPRMTPWWWEFSRPAWMVRTAYRILDALVVDPIIAPSINRARKSLGLKSISRVMDGWWLSPDRILAMYPDWFAPATQQFSPRLMHCGFPLSDETSLDQLESEDKGHEITLPINRPLVFTAGTAHQHSRSFFDQAVATCVQLDHPGLLLSSHPETIPPELPSIVRGLGYVPLSKLLPTCSVAIHHGGVGTTSACLAAGIPQIVRPMAFDQFDHATRVQRMGVGKWLRHDRDLTEIIRSVLADTSIRSAAKRLHERIAQSPSAVVTAANLIEEQFEREDLARRSRR